MPDDEVIDQTPVDPTETGGETNPTTGGDTTGDEPTEETKEDTFPSFRKAYQYRGGFDKFVYDQLKKANGEE